MADGPRCKRRKQANPKRSSVTNVNGGLEASSSDSDDDDKLHIVEDESPPDAEESAVARGDRRDAKNATDANNTVLTHNGAWNGVKEECASKEEEEEEEDEDEEDGKGGERRGDVEPQRGMKKELAVEELLQKGDTAVIYPEAPDDQQSPAETAGVDENGTPDGLQLHTCPYCSRGYKRNASLKEHIKYRHETSEDNYRCSHCSYTFTYRSQLERHMSHHRGSKEQGRHVQPSGGGGGSGGGARKFKCTECFKAFKYKHHLKEHLRIHSGEKPYECANCKKRFSHSGSYSSHISSKKCVSVASAPNGLSRKSVKPLPSSADIPGVAVASGRMVLKEKPESKPLQEQLPVTQIKSEATELPCKPAVAAAPSANGAAPQPQSLSQGVAMVLPTVGLVPPININLSDLQNVLKLALDGNVLRQVLGTANGATVQGKPGIVVQQPQQQIISLPAFVDHDGTTKIIINYSIGPAPATTAATTATTTQPMPLFVKNNLVPAAPIPTKTDKPPTPKVDLSLVKEEPEESVLITETKTDQVKSIKTEDAEVLPPDTGSSTCSLCDECPENLEALHLLQHHKAANGEAVDSAALDPSFAALLSDAGVTLAQEPAVDDLLTLLKTYFASNANPDQEELEKLSDSVRIPVNVVRKWFAKMNSGKKICQDEELSKKTEPLNCESEATKQVSCQSPSDSPSLNTSDLVIIKSEPEDPETLDSQAEPLDLSLPKQVPTPTSAAPPEDTPTSKKPQQPVSLACLRKEQVGGRTIYVATPQTHRTAVNIVPTSQLPTLVAITGQGPVGCLGTIGGSAKRTILIPQLTYTYAHSAGTAAKTVVLNGHKTPETSSDGAAEEQREMSVMKKPRLENGVYSCDLCNKAFQKGSSLLRHKYEHTGKRPHECPVCHKAFKHKHHLIEHSRLHSGEKPYQCNKCGKRFSHSGSYSQHMNHRYSYCKRDGSDYGSSPDADATPATVDAGSPSAALDSDVGESEDDDEAMCVDDIRVVQVDDGECEIYEGNFDDDDDDDEDDGDDEEEDNVEKGVEKEEAHEEEKEKNLDVDEFACQVVEVELKDEQTPESAVEDKADKAEAAGVNLEQMADCTYKRIRDWSDSEESSDDQAVTDSK